MPWNANARLLSLAAALTIGATASAGAANVHGGTSTSHIATSANAFGMDLLGKLVQAKPSENCFISPYSIQQALLLADNGAAGVTKTQIETVLHLESTPLTSINAQTKALRDSLTSADPKVKISVANALWADRSFKFSPSYQETCRAFFDAQARTVAFRQPSGAAAINAWVARKTEGKITKIVSREMLVLAKAVLTNALYFHGAWTTPFQRSGTYPQAFHLTPQSIQQAPTMSRQGMIDYAKSAGYEAVALPYGGGRLRMIAVLPDENSDVNAFVKSLTLARWSSLTDHLTPTRLRLFLPRVHADFGDSLRPELIGLGVHDAFRMNADFTPMDGHPDLYISDVLHKTTLDIDEEGATASAATAVIMQSKAMMMPPPVTVRFDRPFFCAIEDTRTGLLLFAGAIRKPQ